MLAFVWNGVAFFLLLETAGFSRETAGFSRGTAVFETENHRF